MHLVFGFISFLIGVTVTLQSAVNGRLRSVTGNPVFASLASFLGGMGVLLVLLPATDLLGIWSVPTAAQILSTKPWMWTGGIFGTLLVLSAVLLPRKIGFASYFSMLVAGQLAGSVVADATGFLSSDSHTPSPLRLIGVAALILGAILIQKPGNGEERKS